MAPKVEDTLSRTSLKAAVWYTVAKIVEEEELGISLAASENFTACLTEVVFNQALTLAKDLESFARHANRTTVAVEDVKLVTRRNEALYELIAAQAVKQGVTLAELRPKLKTQAQAKARRISEPVKKDKTKSKDKEKEKEKEKKESKSKTTSTTTSKGKGKTKAAVVEESDDEIVLLDTEDDDDDDDAMDEDEDDEPVIRKKQKVDKKKSS